MPIPRPIGTPSNVQAPGFAVTNSAYHTAGDEIGHFAAVGETVEYDIVSKNNGNVDLRGATVEDPLFSGRPSCKPAIAIVFVWIIEYVRLFSPKRVVGGFITKSRVNQGANTVLNIGSGFYEPFVTLSYKGVVGIPFLLDACLYLSVYLRAPAVVRQDGYQYSFFFPPSFCVF